MQCRPYKTDTDAIFDRTAADWPAELTQRVVGRINVGDQRQRIKRREKTPLRSFLNAAEIVTARRPMAHYPEYLAATVSYAPSGYARDGEISTRRSTMTEELEVSSSAPPRKNRTTKTKNDAEDPHSGAPGGTCHLAIIWKDDLRGHSFPRSDPRANLVIYEPNAQINRTPSL